MTLGRVNSGCLRERANKKITRSAAAIGLAAICTTANASVIDRPYFRAESIVIVFGASDFVENGGIAPVAFDFNLLDTASGTAATDLIGVDGVTANFNTGTYNPSSDGSEQVTIGRTE